METIHPNKTKKTIKLGTGSLGLFPPRPTDFPELTRRKSDVLDGEFDPGSGRTLAAGLTHASRTRSIL